MPEPAGDTGQRSRGRPAAFDRDAAIRAAMDTFWRRGFEPVSVSDLAGAMGISRSSFYNSFGDRESVFREALAVYRKSTPDAALDEPHPGEPVAPLIRRVFRRICHVRAADREARGCLLVNSVGELVGVNDSLGGNIRDALADAERMYAAILAQAIRRGEIGDPGDLRVLARAFVTFVAGLNTLSKVIRDEGALWAVCESFLGRYGI